MTSAGFNAALQAMAAERLMEARRTDEAGRWRASPLRSSPATSRLMACETGLTTGQPAELDVRALVLGLEPGDGPEGEAPHGAGTPAAPPEPEAGAEPEAGDY